MCWRIKNELKSAEVDSVNNFIKDKVQSSSDAEVFTEDDADTEKDRIIRFRWNVCDWQQNIQKSNRHGKCKNW